MISAVSDFLGASATASYHRLDSLTDEKVDGIQELLLQAILEGNRQQFKLLTPIQT
jgi:hypothetical protein